MWTRGGRELVFRRGDSMMAWWSNPAPVVGAPVLLFAGPYESGAGWTNPRDYDVTPDGERFVLLKWPLGVARRRVFVATHWLDELRARVDGQGGQ